VVLKGQFFSSNDTMDRPGWGKVVILFLPYPLGIQSAVLKYSLDRSHLEMENKKKTVLITVVTF
jgi:hypothetical protein